MTRRTLFLIAACCAVTACGPSGQQTADYDTVARSGVSPAIYDKMTHGDPLSVGDICALSKARVSEGIIVRYIRDQGTVYGLTSGDIDRLRAAGVSQSLIDFMIHTNYPGAGAPPIPVSIGIGVGGFFH